MPILHKKNANNVQSSVQLAMDQRSAPHANRRLNLILLMVFATKTLLNAQMDPTLTNCSEIVSHVQKIVNYVLDQLIALTVQMDLI